MKKATILLIVLAAIAVPVFGNSAGVTYTEQYRWHGFKLYGDNYIHPGVTTQVQGIDIAAGSHYLNEGNDLKQWDTELGADIPIIDGLDLRAGYGYLLLPGMDVQELSGTISLPGNVSPRYTISHIVPDNAKKGQIHVLGLDIGLGDTFDPNAVSAILAADVTYIGGVNPLGGRTVHDITHFSAALVLNVPAGNVILHPGICYQHNFEDVLGPDRNEAWYTLSMTYLY